MEINKKKINIIKLKLQINVVLLKKLKCKQKFSYVKNIKYKILRNADEFRTIWSKI